MRAIIFAATSLFFSSFCFGQQKINGLTLVAGPDPIGQEVMTNMSATNANWITLVPYASSKSGTNRITFKDIDWQWWGESPDGVRESIKLAKKEGLKVMIKPQLWFDHGSYTGHFECSSDEGWASFESDYHDYIFQFVEIAAEEGAEMFCIGTELTKWCLKRPEFWSELIRDIRLMYDGKLVYAANWDAYKRMPFWSSLDYIGIDAYFPLCDHKTPSEASCIDGWAPHKKEIKKLSTQYGKPVIFCEWGFRSMDYTGLEPWKTDRGGGLNLQGQKNAYEATFECFWNESWFHGGFIWKWFGDHDKFGGSDNNRFTPQNKPAEEVIRRRFMKFSH